jgi:hypothetical protein
VHGGDYTAGRTRIEPIVSNVEKLTVRHWSTSLEDGHPCFGTLHCLPVTDQHITAVATIVQDILLFASAVLIGWYLCETRKMRLAAEKQVSKSQELVDAAQKQLAASLAQTEAQIRPALAVGLQGGVQLQNVGNGTAFNVAVSVIDDLAREINWAPRLNVLSEVVASYLEPGEDSDRRAVLADRQFGPDTGLQLRYQSLSGRKYVSLVTLGMDGRVIRTRFVEELD